MSQNQSADNKRIAKNTLLLYFRMLLTMTVSLYTSRVVLSTLGVEDFGVYNVVGGVVSMLGFLTGSLGSATSRFITYALGLSDFERLKQTFANILAIHCLFAVVIVSLAETVGLWILNSYIQVPVGREDAAFGVYQFLRHYSVLSVFPIMQVS